VIVSQGYEGERTRGVNAFVCGGETHCCEGESALCIVEVSELAQGTEGAEGGIESESSCCEGSGEGASGLAQEIACWCHCERGSEL